MNDARELPVQETLPDRTRSELGKRVISAIILGLVAVGTAWLGGIPFILFWAFAAAAVWWEWLGVVQVAQRPLLAIVGAVSIAGMAIALAAGVPAFAFVSAVIGAAVAMSAGQIRRVWVGAGIFYAAAVLIPAAMLREHVALGFVTLLWLFATVWATDTGAYFAGRAFGGPKLAPSVSPKKTWSGAIGGTLAGLIASQAVLYVGGIAWHPMHMVAALLVIVAAQLGDLLESGIKRHFAVKDAGTLLPGHGGVMDRLDGFLTAALVALLIGLIAGGVQAPAAGLLSW
jgi:phosphatidate cytidylyltransferase